MQTPLSKVAFAVLHVGLAAVVLVSGSVKLAHPGSHTELIHLNPYPRWFTSVIGAVLVESFSWYGRRPRSPGGPALRLPRQRRRSDFAVVAALSTW